MLKEDTFGCLDDIDTVFCVPAYLGDPLMILSNSHRNAKELRFVGGPTVIPVLLSLYTFQRFDPEPFWIGVWKVWWFLSSFFLSSA
jgi:hypothetical protein